VVDVTRTIRDELHRSDHKAVKSLDQESPFRHFSPSVRRSCYSFPEIGHFTAQQPSTLMKGSVNNTGLIWENDSMNNFAARLHQRESRENHRKILRTRIFHSFLLKTIVQATVHTETGIYSLSLLTINCIKEIVNTMHCNHLGMEICSVTFARRREFFVQIVEIVACYRTR
jgi:hypothetical protein